MKGPSPSSPHPLPQVPLSSHICVPSPCFLSPFDPTDSLLYLVQRVSVLNVNSSLKKMSFQDELPISRDMEGMLASLASVQSQALTPRARTQ